MVDGKSVSEIIIEVLSSPQMSGLNERAAWNALPEAVARFGVGLNAEDDKKDPKQDKYAYSFRGGVKKLGRCHFRNLRIWVKNNAGMGSLYRSRHELVFVFKHGTGKHRNNVELGRHGRHRSNVWEYPGVNSFGRKGEEGDLLAIHPTVKPVTMVADAILDRAP